MSIHELVMVIYAIWIGIVILAIAVCAIDILRNQGDEPQRTLLWFTVIAAFPIFGVILYFLTGRTRKAVIGGRGRGGGG